MIDLTKKRIVVTGGDGFLGHHLIPLLEKKCKRLDIVSHKTYELLHYEHATHVLFDFHPDIVVHLAARVGGIQYNQVNPGILLYENLKMGINIIHSAMVNEIEKFVCLGTTCMYPRTPQIPFKEDDIWDEYPEPTNAPYGISKRALLEMCQSYRKQYGMNCIFLMPVNMYGEWDNFSDEQGHVIPMLVKRFLNAKENNLPEVVVWGSGTATREFLYAGDCAKAIVRATEVYDKPEPMNIGSGQETSIAELVELIAKIIGYEGKIVWDKTKPDGQPRRLLDITRMKTELGYDNVYLQVSLRDGLERTIKWYKENR